MSRFLQLVQLTAVAMCFFQAQDVQAKQKRIEDTQNTHFANSKVSDYLAAPTGSQDFAKDFDHYFRTQKSSGKVPDSPEFIQWVNSHKTQLTSPEYLSRNPDLSGKMYMDTQILSFAVDQANLIDQNDPNTGELNKQGQLTKGQIYLNNFLDQQGKRDQKHSMFSGAAIKGAAIAGVSAVLFAVYDTIRLTFGLRLGNKVLDRYISPWEGALDRWMKRNTSKSAALNALMASDIPSTRKEVEDFILHGKPLSEKAKKLYGHPAMQIRKNAEDQFEFWKLHTETDQIWGFHLSQDLKNARNTGFDFYFVQPEQAALNLSTYEAAEHDAWQTIRWNIWPELEKKYNISMKEAEDLHDLVMQQERSLKIHWEHPELASKFDEPLEKIYADWVKRGVPKTLMNELYDAEVKLTLGQLRTAFTLYHALQRERYYTEITTAMRKYPHLQDKQEFARSVIGLYDKIKSHAPIIQEMFELHGIEYDINKRLEVKGIPFGSDLPEGYVNKAWGCYSRFMRKVVKAP